jgi:hypothetical protein
MESKPGFAVVCLMAACWRKHKAIGKLTVLTVCIPRGVLNDVHELE